VLKVMLAILKLMRCSLGSQWSYMAIILTIVSQSHVEELIKVGGSHVYAKQRCEIETYG